MTGDAQSCIRPASLLSPGHQHSTIMGSHLLQPSSERVILVDRRDRERGTEEKHRAHMRGERHRGFSVFIFSSDGKYLLQQRALSKYHSGGLWANACCGHPRPGESLLHAAHRRLREEMGFDAPIEEMFSYTYKVGLDHGLTEHEFLHVFRGRYDGPVRPNPVEAQATRQMERNRLLLDLLKRPDCYAKWFPASVLRFYELRLLEKGKRLALLLPQLDRVIAKQGIRILARHEGGTTNELL